jgi:hypothetical protein
MAFSCAFGVAEAASVDDSGERVLKSRAGFVPPVTVVDPA